MLCGRSALHTGSQDEFPLPVARKASSWPWSVPKNTRPLPTTGEERNTRSSPNVAPSPIHFREREPTLFSPTVVSNGLRPRLAESPWNCTQGTNAVEAPAPLPTPGSRITRSPTSIDRAKPRPLLTGGTTPGRTMRFGLGGVIVTLPGNALAEREGFEPSRGSTPQPV